MEDIIDTLESIVKHKDILGLKVIAMENMIWIALSTSLVEGSNVYGRDEDKETIMKLLLDDNSDCKIIVLAIIGMGGVGKITCYRMMTFGSRILILKHGFVFMKNLTCLRLQEARSMGGRCSQKAARVSCCWAFGCQCFEFLDQFEKVFQQERYPSPFALPNREGSILNIGAEFNNRTRIREESTPEGHPRPYSSQSCKAVASMMSHGEEEFSKALGDPLYVRIRESLHGINGSKAKDGKELKQVAKVLPAEDFIESKQDGANDVSQEDKSNQYANNVISMAVNEAVLNDSKAFGEIVEADSEDTVQSGEDHEEVNEMLSEEVDSSMPKGMRSVYISSEVEQTLETLDKAISVAWKYRLRSRMASCSFPNEESPRMTNGGRLDSHSAKLIHQNSKSEVTVEVLDSDRPEGTLREAPATNSDIQNFRHTGTNSNLKEVNSNKVVPNSPKQNLLRPIEVTQITLENGETLNQTPCGNKQLYTDSVQDMSSDDPNKSSNKKKINTIVPQGMSSDVPKKSSRRRK